MTHMYHVCYICIMHDTYVPIMEACQYVSLLICVSYECLSKHKERPAPRLSMVGRADGRAGGRTGGRTDGRTDGRTCERMDGFLGSLVQGGLV